jgi:hypothetical protein
VRLPSDSILVSSRPQLALGTSRVGVLLLTRLPRRPARPADDWDLAKEFQKLHQAAVEKPEVFGAHHDENNDEDGCHEDELLERLAGIEAMQESLQKQQATTAQLVTEGFASLHKKLEELLSAGWPAGQTPTVI